jgi:hypothetical protein
MRTLLFTAALLVAYAGAARAEVGAPSAPAEKPAKAQQAGAPKGAKGKADAKAKAAQKAPPPQGQGQGAARVNPPQDNKPCEPVKPCPID